MSASRPSKRSSGSPSAALGSRLARRRSGGNLWFAISVALHALALAGLIYLTPVRQLVREFTRPSRPEKNMSGAELARLADAIEFHAAEQIEANTGALGRALDAMGEIQDGIAQQFAAFDQRRRENAARDALDEMEKAATQMRRAVESITEDTSAEPTDRSQALAERAQEKAREKLEMVGFNVVSITTGQVAAEEAHQQAKAVHYRHTTQKTQVQRLGQLLATEQRRAEQIRQQMQTLKDANRPQAQIDAYVPRLEEQEKRVGEVAQQLEAGREDQSRLHREAAESQELALAVQERVADGLRELMAERAESSAAPPSVAASGGQQFTTGLAFSRPTGQQRPGAGGAPDVAQLYERARTLEDDIAETFKEVRAMDLAIVRDMQLEDARHDIDLIRPVRPDLDAALLREPTRTDERFQAHKEEIQKALRETSSMVNLAQRMLEMATQSVAKMKFGTGVQLAAEEEAPDFRLIIRELAMEEVTGRFSDLADVMRAMDQEEGEQQGGSARRGASGDGGAGEELDYKDLTAEELAGLGMLPRFGPEGPDGGEGLVPDLPPDVPAVGARKLSPRGEPGQWMFIDTWYTIGPFPNPDRINIDRAFPPDSLVDLDATYVGKDGRTIRWEFAQSGGPEVVPPNAEPYGIWYAYTEFQCDRPRDVLIALGTDDRGDLRINGVDVWVSSKQLKAWDIDEVWRRVHFNEGVNRILYRVENGWQHVAFSLVLRLAEP